MATIKLDQKAGSAVLCKVFDLTGHVVIDNDFEVVSKNETIQIDTELLKKGIYRVEIRDTSNELRTTFIKI